MPRGYKFTSMHEIRRPSNLRALEKERYTINPLKKTRQNLGLSQAKLADLCGISPGAVLKYEQGLYQEPSHKILNVLAAVGLDQDCIINLEHLTEDYYQWRLIHQAAQRWVFADVRVFRANDEEHPFRTLRRTVGRGYTVQGFAVLLAVHPSTIQDYDSGKVRSMPGPIRDALEVAGCRESVLVDINKFGEQHYDEKRAND